MGLYELPDVMDIEKRIAALEELCTNELNERVKMCIRDAIQILMSDAENIRIAHIQGTEIANYVNGHEEPGEQARQKRREFEQYLSKPHDYDEVYQGWGRIRPTLWQFLRKELSDKWAVYEKAYSKRVPRMKPNQLAGMGEDLFSELFNPMMSPHEIEEYCRLAKELNDASNLSEKKERGGRFLDFLILLFNTKWEIVEKSAGKEGHWHFYPENRV